MTTVAGPALGPVLAHVAGVVAELGGSTSHLASLACERGVPLVWLDQRAAHPGGRDRRRGRRRRGEVDAMKAKVVITDRRESLDVEKRSWASWPTWSR